MYHPIITHDIDRYYKWQTVKSLLGELKRKMEGNSTWGLNEMWKSYKNRKQNDPFSNIREIAEMNVEYGIDSVFYMMTTEEAHPKNINDYKITNPKIQADLKYILNLGVEIGIHPGYLTSNDGDKIAKQKKQLEDVIGQEVKRSRQHYLRYDPDRTFNLLAKTGITNDSSIYPTDAYNTYSMDISQGGVNHTFTQTPLVFMETHHMNKTDDEILAILEKSLAPAKKHQGEVMILWHNNSISNRREKALYKEALQVIKKQ